jgi:hypothetical protein
MRINTDQEAKEPRHPRSKSTARGTDSPAAIAAKSDMIVAINAVIRPSFCGSLTLINGINSTFAITIPIPVIPVPINNSSIPPKTRRIIPKASKIIARKIALPIPNRFPIAGAKSEKVANVNKGRVVRNPAKPLESPKSARMNGIKGPTDEIEVRRFTAIKMMPVIRKPWWLGVLFKMG